MLWVQNRGSISTLNVSHVLCLLVCAYKHKGLDSFAADRLVIGSFCR